MLIDVPAKILLMIVLFVVVGLVIGALLLGVWQSKYGNEDNTAPIPHKPPQQKDQSNE